SDLAAIGLTSDARRACLKSLISDCQAGRCSCTGGSPPCSCVCGDGLCGPSEDCGTCPQDCGACCGNGTCEPSRGDDCATCPPDCGTCPTTTTTTTTTTTPSTTTTSTTVPGAIQCCVPLSPICNQVTPDQCTAQGGIDHGSGTCSPNPCRPRCVQPGPDCVSCGTTCPAGTTVCAWPSSNTCGIHH